MDQYTADALAFGQEIVNDPNLSEEEKIGLLNGVMVGALGIKIFGKRLVPTGAVDTLNAQIADTAAMIRDLFNRVVNPAPKGGCPMFLAESSRELILLPVIKAVDGHTYLTGNSLLKKCESVHDLTERTESNSSKSRCCEYFRDEDF